MKALTRTLGVFILSILVFNTSMAQKAIFTTNRGMTIGFGGGMAYQKSDLANSKGLGFDFILGSQLYKKENAFLSVDWKFRFLAGENKAYDHRINPDNTYSNIRYSFFNYDLELGLTLNRLRERTRIVLTGFAGAGITHGRTFTDLYDVGNNLYDYSSIDPNRESKLVYEDLLSHSDGNFETQLVNKAAILPTAGLFIGYQLSRSLTLGIEFKTNFYLTERNSLAGIDLDNRVIAGSGLDRNSYISLGLSWTLRGGSSQNRGLRNNTADVTKHYRNNNVSTHPNPNTTKTRNRVVPVSLPPPSVNITDPSADSYHTDYYTHTIKATVDNVSGPDNISFSQNGFPNNKFTYNVTTKIFIANINLRDGENSIRIKATNQTSTAEDLVIITLDNTREAVKPAPAVVFISPSENQITSSSERIDVTASVKNISNKQDIQLKLNGSNTPFEYYPVSGLVKTSLMLDNGDNNLLIKGFNESGSAQDQLTVNFNNPEKIAIPAVRFINPATQVDVKNSRFPLRAATQNVRRRNDITVKLNSASIGNFSFSANGEVSVSLLLSDGVNTIEITARNEAGVASERTSITYNIAVVRTSPPVINIISPVTDPVRTYEPSEELRATVLNVNTKEDITVNINGSNTRNFNFNNSTRVLTTRFVLRDGKNVLTINAQNESGGDVKDQVFFKETRHCPPPVIRLIDPAQGQTNTNQQSYAVSAEVGNITNSNQLRLTVNGKPVSFRFINNLVSSSVPLIRGLNTLSLNAKNECGVDNASARITYIPSVIVDPCTPPKLSFTVNEVNRNDATHELRGSISGVKNKADISLTVNGRADNGFRFVPTTGDLSASFTLKPGSHTIVISVQNSCGTASKSVTLDRGKPCTPPKVSFTVNEVNHEEATHELMGSISGVKNKTDISLTVNGRADNGFRFVPAKGDLSATFKLKPGSHTIVISVKNACGTDSRSVTINRKRPCTPPKVSFTVNEVNRNDATHELMGSISGVKNKTDISLTVNGRADNGFRFVPTTGDLSARFKLKPGSYTIVISVKNACGTDSRSVTVNKEEPCTPPKLSFTVNKVNRNDATHELRGSISGVKNKADISLTVNGRADNGFQFVPATGDLSARFKLTPGSHTIVISVKNACGTDSRSVTINMEEPCTPPKLSFTVNEVNRNDATHELRGSISGVKNKADISLTVNGRADNGFQFVPATDDLSARFKLTPGSHTIVISVKNACGTDSRSVTINMEEPCTPPKLSFTVNEVNRNDATHELRGSISDVKNKADISLTVNGRADNGFQFVPTTGDLSARFKLTPGSHTIVISVKNACGTDSKSQSVTVDEEACGLRINPGNSIWQFCLVTPSGTFSRENLTNTNFSYSGPATSLYFMPIGGGGNVMVKGNPYAIRSGQYYLFTGKLSVTVSTKNPGSMGHWSVCISAEREPVSGNGKNRPKSPCEVVQDDSSKGKGNKR